MDNGLIIVKQLPVIEDQLAAVKESITERVNQALSLVCTEDTYKDIKKVRADLNKEYAELEAKRKEVKTAVLAPYEKFEKVYKECAGDLYADADRKLKAKIAEVEEGLRQQKITAVCDYFVEYRESLGLSADLVKYDDMGIKVGLSDSLTGLKKKVKDFLDHISDDLKAIESHEDKDEIMTEYRRGFNLANALSTVAARHKAIEDAKRLREEAEARRKAQEEQQKELAAIIAAQAEQEALPAAPAVVEVAQVIPEPEAAPAAPEAVKMYSATFKVTGTLDQLKALKKFLEEGGYTYEC
jgi:predicted transposase YbfD/YdcC